MAGTSFSGFFHQTGTRPPTHRDELAAALGEADDVNCRGECDVVAGPEVFRRANDADKGVNLGPDVALREPTAHAGSLAAAVADNPILPNRR